MLAGAGGAVAAGIVASPASGVTNLYAPQSVATTGGELTQFAVAPDGSLSALAPEPLSAGPSDVAVTPDGRFAYVALSSAPAAGIAEFVRGPAGRMQSAGSADVINPFGILVNPQGTRVFYSSTATNTVESRPIDPATGDLGAATVVAMGPNSVPQFLAMTPSGTSLYVGTLRDAPAQILQFDVDPATGALTPKSPALADWPSNPSAPQQTPVRVARMTVSPDAGHLYAASATGDTGLAHFAIDPATGALVGGSVVGAPPDASSTSVAPITPDGSILWAPTSFVPLAPGRIDRFSVGVGGALAALNPAAAYVVDAPTRDAVSAPDGRTLYLGQDANVGDWTIGAGGSLTPRANFPGPPQSAGNGGLAVAPSQAPVASFTASPRPAGQATTFDAAASADPDGSIARYDWDFGDGTTAAAAGPAPSHVYATTGRRNVSLTVFDADGTSTGKLWTGSRMLRNGGPSAQATVAVTITAGSTPPPPPPPPGAPRPDKGSSVTIVATSGTVRVKLPGSRRYVDVKLLREIPLGSTIDARRGRVRLTAEVDAKTHRTQSSLFYSGKFKVLQTKGRKPVLVAKMVGGTFAGCSPVQARAAAVSSRAAGAAVRLVARRARSKRTVRKLWGHGKGDFRTTGRRSSATVRGTWWLVQDRCDGTLTRVKQGSVDVRDVRRHTTIRLRPGKRRLYLAKSP
jgi:6-phosphogluconolactonase (cycloisomerase 2 family)